MVEEDEVFKEIEKCRESPYYFATKYLNFKSDSKNGFIEEVDFNKLFFNYMKKM